MKIRKKGRVVGTKKRPAVTYVLRTCEADMSSSCGFVWPASGPVAADDWMPTEECGHGLHGWLLGEGDGSLGVFGPDIKWLVVEVERKLIVDLGGKVKFPRGVVVYCGDRAGAVELLLANAAHPQRVIGGSLVVADKESGSAGARATVSGGDGATVSGGYRATVSGGARATVSGGDGATVSGGYRATVSGGDGATVSGGDGATVSGGDGATVSGGYGATVSGGYGATVSGGARSAVVLRWWDGPNDRWRLVVGYVGEDGVKPNTAYRLNDAHRIEEVSAGKDPGTEPA